MADEVSGVLDQLLGVVQAHKQDENTQAGNGGWIAGLVVAVLALIAVAIFAWQAWQAGKETAKLLHEKAVQKEAEHQALVNVLLANEQETKDNALAAVEVARDEIKRLEEEAVRLEETRQRARDAIDKISSWEDVDAIVR